jgi:hypothetical protein
VLSLTFQVVLFAVVAAASPLALTATLVVIRSERPRTNGIAYLSGFLFGTLFACVLGLLVGVTFVNRLDSHSELQSVVVLLVGIALLAIGLRSKTDRTDVVGDGTGRGAAIMAGLGEMGPGAASSMAALLGFGGPKRLLLTLLAMAAVSTAGRGVVVDATLVVSYVVIATSLVWAPVGVMLIAPDRAQPFLARTESWSKAHAVPLRFWFSVGFGAALVIDAAVRLIS